MPHLFFGAEDVCCIIAEKKVDGYWLASFEVIFIIYIPPPKVKFSAASQKNDMYVLYSPH